MKFIHLRCILLIHIFFVISLPAFAQKKHTVKKSTTKTTEGNTVKNGIRLTNNGFKISEAYLFFDDESLVPEGNKVALNQNVNMLLIIDSGWADIGGRVFPGAKQVLKLSSGKEILNSEELFATFDTTGVAPEDARYVTLNAVITEMKDKKNHVIVNFRVWDKKGTAEIMGSYKLYIK
ncbi:MAG: hypothetical protein ABIQ31_25495 [Ferruginibacter sp.]